MMKEYQETLDKVNSLKQTENGATGYATTGKNLVDLNFRVPSNHNNVGSEDMRTFVNALKEDMVTTVKWLFYLRDVREGLGERVFLSFLSLVDGRMLWTFFPGQRMVLTFLISSVTSL